MKCAGLPSSLVSFLEENNTNPKPANWKYRESRQKLAQEPQMEGIILSIEKKHEEYEYHFFP